MLMLRCESGGFISCDCRTPGGRELVFWEAIGVYKGGGAGGYGPKPVEMLRPEAWVLERSSFDVESDAGMLFGIAECVLDAFAGNALSVRFDLMETKLLGRAMIVVYTVT